MLKMFDKWACNEVKVIDPGLAKYLGLEDMLIPHTFGVESGKKYTKKSINIVERLVNKLMRTGQGKKKLGGKFIRGRGNPGNKLKVMKIVENAFDTVEERTKTNPIQQLVMAIQNSSPREDVTRLKKGGVAYSESV
ncbi:MAG: 30S ribosomal protein S7, partial [Candidatus Diapherotrites archaeon CG09_land_8_20_14_0_10_32_12]